MTLVRKHKDSLIRTFQVEELYKGGLQYCLMYQSPSGLIEFEHISSLVDANKRFDTLKKAAGLRINPMLYVLLRGGITGLEYMVNREVENDK